MFSLIAPLFRLSFWFDLQTQPFSPWVEYLILTLILALLVGVFVASWLRREEKEKLMKRVWSKVLGACLSASLIGLMLYAFTWQRIPLLGMRIFWPIWFLSHAAWGASIYKRATKEIPETRRAQAKRQAYEKWLPKAKK